MTFLFTTRETTEVICCFILLNALNYVTGSIALIS